MQPMMHNNAYFFGGYSAEQGHSWQCQYCGAEERYLVTRELAQARGIVHAYAQHPDQIHGVVDHWRGQRAESLADFRKKCGPFVGA